MKVSARKLNDVQKISDKTFRWKISFNSDVSKQPQEVIFSQEIKTTKIDPSLVSNNTNVQCNNV